MQRLHVNSTFLNAVKARGNFHKVGENFKAEDYVITPNTMKLLEEHVKVVHGKPVFRFPPTPNGILHVGHARAININFGLAKAMGGTCILRFDDTNPDDTNEKYVNSIIENVNWLGFVPDKITYTSDYFDQLYQWAVQLIKKKSAYVCHLKMDEIRSANVQSSQWRNRPVEESLQIFEDMKNGLLQSGHATLRLKISIGSENYDPVAYRIRNKPHYKTMDKLRVYPTYDFSHGLCDSLENITHSLCTKEFQSQRSLYYWLCNTLGIYCPVQWEYGRLNINYTVTSKKKIAEMIENRIVRGWDDPRLFTLPALRRRGIPSEAINEFVARVGLPVQQISVDSSLLDEAVRNQLEMIAPRTMAVLDPLKIRIQNYKDFGFSDKHYFQVSHLPGNEECRRTYDIAFDETIYIEKTDYREKADRKYNRLTDIQPVGLKHSDLALQFISAVKNDKGEVVEIVGKIVKRLDSKPRARSYIHWVAKPVECEVRIYGQLFKNKNPTDETVVPGGYLSDCILDSICVLPKVLVDESIAKSAKESDSFQFERVGYFCVDKDSNEKKIVFNQIAPLAENAYKKSHG